MSNKRSVLLGVGLIAALSMAIDWEPAFAQRVVGGGNQKNRDRDKDRDDDEDGERDGKKQSTLKQSSRSGRTQVQINQSLPRNQAGQSSQPGQFGQRDRARQGGKNADERLETELSRGNDGRSDRRGDDPFGQFSHNRFRPGNDARDVRFGGWQGDKWSGSRDVKNWSRVFAGGKQPFSSDWYRKHPKAWKFDNDRANVWVTASLPGVYSFLGWRDAPTQQGGIFVRPDSFDHRHYGRWYPLGVFSLMSGPGDMGTRIVQLAIDQHGHIAGNYYDIITDTNSSVSGEVRRQSQRVEWSLNKNDDIRFRVPLHRLFQPYGSMTVSMPGGEADWQFVRLEHR